MIRVLGKQLKKNIIAMLFLLLKIRIETTRLDLILNLKREWIKKHKRWKYLKISGRILKLCKSVNWILGVHLERLIFKRFLIDLEKTEVSRSWSILI